VRSTKIKLFPLIRLSSRELCAKPRVAEEVWAVPHKQLVLLLLRQSEEARDVTLESIGVDTRVIQVQEANGDRSMLEVGDELRLRGWVLGQGPVKHRYR
jgi:hypothetical protein